MQPEWVTTSTILAGLNDPADPSAWERLCVRFRTPIVRFAREIGLSVQDAEDVAQETLIAFAKAHRDGRYDRSLGRLSHWLFGIARRRALAARRVRARDAKVAREPDRPSFWDRVADRDSLSECWERQWERCVLEECLSRVRIEVAPEKMRAFELVVRAGRKPADVAAELGIPAKSVYNAKYAVLKRMRELRADLEQQL